MKTMLQRWTALMAALLLVLTAACALAEDSKTCGENLTWALDDAGTLTISGSGEMDSYSYNESFAPWHDSCAQILSVVLEEGVTSIGSYAFDGCTALTGVTIPEGVTAIGGRAFDGCSALGEVTIPQSVTSIEYYAFSGCTQAEITLPDNVNSIGSDAFANVKRVYCNPKTATAASLYAASVNHRYCAPGHPDCLFYDKNGETILAQYTGEGGDVEIPAGVTRIERSAFQQCTGLTDVTIPEGVTTIGESAFYDCTALERAALPESLGSIDRYAFFGCSSLASVNLPDSVTAIGESAFQSCESLMAVSIPKGLTSMDAGVFLGCESLKDVTIPKNVTSIGISAFSGCTQAEITLPDDVTSIGEHAFDNVKRLYCDAQTATAASLRAANVGYYYCAPDNPDMLLYDADGKTVLVDYTGEGGEVEIPAYVTEIGAYAFSGCQGLTSVTIPGNVTTIGDSAFMDCSSLTNAVLHEGVTSIGIAAFNYCDLTSVTIPASVTRIGNIAFDGCWNMTSVTVGSVEAWLRCEYGTLTSVPNSPGSDVHLYENGKEITEIVVPDGITAISTAQFSKLSSLTSVTIPDSVTSIGEKAFEGCTQAEVTLPDGVTSIGAHAFDNVERIYCNAQTATAASLRTANVGYYYCAPGNPDMLLYDADGKTVLVAYTGEGGEVEIPAYVTEIGDKAFFGCRGLTGVTIPEGVTSIGDSAFCGCESLADVQLPESLRSIGSSAFSGCRALESLTIPAGVTNIWTGALAYSGLTSIVLPDGLTVVTDNLLRNCESLTAVTIPEGVKSIGLSAFSGCSSLQGVTLPSTVTQIRTSAFDGCTQAEITLPDGVAGIGEHAFDGVKRVYCNTHSATAASLYAASADYRYCAPGHPDCLLYDADDVTTLDQYTGAGGEVQIPAGVNVIADSAFAQCTGLTNVTVPDSVTSIGSSAFSGCTQAEIALPDGVTSIGEHAFDGVKRVYCNPHSATAASLYAASAAYRYCAPGNPDCLLYDADDVTTLDQYTGAGGAVQIPAGVNVISPSVFRDCRAMTAVTIPDSVTQIGSGAFQGCSALTEVSIPAGVASIEENTFNGCVRLARVTLQTGLTSIGSYAFSGCVALEEITLPAGVTAIGNYAFNGCASLTALPLPASVKTIGTSAFTGCANLQEMAIPAGVTRIESETFRECSALARVTIPESVTSIGYAAFEDCSGLTEIALPSGLTVIDGSVFSGCSSLTGLTIPAGVTTIGYDAFTNCSRLASVTIPESVSTISAYAFSGCSSLKDVTIPLGVTAIENYLFSGCSSLERVSLPAGVTRIEGGAFYECSSLKDVTLPQSVISIGAYAFYGCAGLTGLAIPAKVTIIGNCAFSNCSGLTSMTIPAGVTSIGTHAFSGCSGLTSVTIPAGVTSIGASAFYGCSSLAGVTIPAGVTSIGNNAFSGCSSLAGVTIPAGVTSIGESAFYGCSGLKSVTIPEGVERIGEYAFYGCSSLTSVTVPKNVTALEKWVFNSCAKADVILPDGIESVGSAALSGVNRIICTPWTATTATLTRAGYIYNIAGDPDFRVFERGEELELWGYSGADEEVTVPACVTRIGDYAFSGRTSLKNVTIPEGVTDIGNSAFSGCTSLTDMTIPESVTAIGEHAFASCTSLRSVTVPKNVTALGEYVFFDCTQADITLPDGIESVGSNAFMNAKRIICTPQTATAATLSRAGCSYTMAGSPDFLLQDDGEETVLQRYAGEGGAVTIPEGVTRIGSNAFHDCDSLTSVTIPEGVTAIGASAFDNCSALAGVSLPQSIKAIEYRTFALCDSLTDVTIPAGVTSIGAMAFHGCPQAEITLPDGIESIGNAAISNVKRIICTPQTTTAATLSQAGYSYTMAGNPDFLLRDDGGETVLQQYAGEGGAVTIPEGVTRIGDSAFSGRTGLTNVTIPAGVTSIGTQAFFGCTGLTGVTIPAGVTSIGAQAFSGCTSLADVTIPASVTSLGYDAFYNCQQATITLPDGIESVGREAFSAVKRLICTPQTATAAALGRANFSYTMAGSPDFWLQDDGAETKLTRYAGEGGAVTIPEVVTCIGDYAFSGCTSLEGVTIPAGVKTIGYRAFTGCANLQEMAIPTGVTRIASDTFRECSALARVTIPESVTSIEYAAFEDCSSLTEIALPSGLTGIAGSVFSGCSSLTGLTIPAGVTSIGTSAFYNCTQADITLPDGIESVGSEAFSGVKRIICTPQTATAAALGRAGYSYTMAGREEYYLRDEGTTVCVWSYTGPTDAVVIPPQITRWNMGATMTSVCLPSTMNSSSDFALEAENVAVPEGVKDLGRLSLTNAQRLYLPDSAEVFDGVTFIGTPPVIYCSEGSEAEAWALFNGYRTCNDSWESACTLRYSGTIALDVGESLTLDRGSFALAPIPADYRGELTLESAELEVDGMTVTAQAPGDVTLTAWMDGRYSVEIPVHVYQPVERIALQAPTLCQAGNTFSVSVLELAPQDISGRLTWTQDGAIVYEGNELTQTLTAPTGQTTTVIRVTAPGGVSSEVTVRTPETISAPTLASSTVELGSLVEICVEIDGDTVVNDPETYGAISLGSSTTGLRLEGRLVRVTAMGKYPFTVTSLSGKTKYFTVTATDTLHACRTQVPSKEATCTEAGNTAYEICQGCGKFYVPDGESIAEVEEGSWVIPAIAHAHKTLTEAVDATCTTAGNSAYYTCDDCGKFFAADGEGYAEVEKDSWIIPAIAHARKTLTEAVDATCTTAGNSAYYTCDDCGLYFVKDGEGFTEVEEGSWVIPKLSYHRMDNHACVMCGEQFDFASMNVLTLPAGLKHIEEEAFRGSTAQVVVVPEGCQSIGQDAFADCRELRYAVLPAALTDNAEKIFGANVPVLIVVCSGDAD